MCEGEEAGGLFAVREWGSVLRMGLGGGVGVGGGVGGGGGRDIGEEA